MAEHGNTVKKKGTDLRSVPSLDARRPRYWRKEEEAPGRANGKANGQCAERGLVGASNSLAKAPFARDRTSMTPSSRDIPAFRVLDIREVAVAHGVRQATGSRLPERCTQSVTHD